MSLAQYAVSITGKPTEEEDERTVHIVVQAASMDKARDKGTIRSGLRFVREITVEYQGKSR